MENDNPFAKPIKALMEFLFAVVFDVCLIAVLPGTLDAWITDGMLKAVCYTSLMIIALVITLLMPYLTLTTK